MGEIADYYFDMALKEEYELEIDAERVYDAYEKGTLVWKTRGGRKILVNDMSTQHIKNVISFLIKNNSDYSLPSPLLSAVIDVFNKELKKRNRMKEKIIKRINVLSEKIGGLKGARNAFDFNTVQPYFKEFFDNLISDYRRERDFLNSLIIDIDNYCKEQEIIKEHGTVNWQD